MTEQSYRDFLDYLSRKEKQTLCSHLEKRFKVNGFRSVNTVPHKILAQVLAKNELKLFNLLQDCYSPTFANKDEAIGAFTPDTAVLCFTYFVKESILDENTLMQLLQKQEPSAVIPGQLVSDNRFQKKTDEFRKKYLATYKVLTETKERLESVQRENTELKKEINQKEQALSALENKMLSVNAERERENEALKRGIDELKKYIQEQDRIIEQHETQSLVLLKENDINIPGVTVLLYDDITQLTSVINNFSELLFVANDLPFRVKRHIYKYEILKEKMHVFSTNNELLEYLGKRR